MNKKIFFQIGTNDGNDTFLQMVKSEKPDLTILIEPNKELIKLIEKNYLNINFKIYNNAVYYEDDKEVELVIPAEDGIFGRKGTNDVVYGIEHYSLLPMTDWGEKKDMNKILAKTITFETIMKENDIKEIDYLEIDTEGFDYEIINMIDFEKYKINQLRFEIFDFDSDKCYSKYSKEKRENLGKEGLKNTIKKLESLGYIISDITPSDKLAILRI